MTTSLTKISTSSKITNFVTWPIQSKANSIRTSLPIIVFVATKMLANTSYLHSLLITGITLISSEFIYHQMNKSNNLNEPLPEEYDAFFQAQAREQRGDLLKAKKVDSDDPAAKRAEIRTVVTQKKSNGLIAKVQSSATDLKEKNKQFIPLGKLLVHKSLCTEKFYQDPLVLQSLKFFKVKKDTIEEAWRKFPNEDEFDSRLDFLFIKVDREFHAYLVTLKKDYNFLFKIMSNQSMEDIISSLNTRNKH